MVGIDIEIEIEVGVHCNACVPCATLDPFEPIEIIRHFAEFEKCLIQLNYFKGKM